MRRKVANNDMIKGLDLDHQIAADSLGQWVGKPKKCKPKSGSGHIQILVEKVRRKTTEELKNCNASELVALYYHCHSKVYGIDPIDLKGATWRRAVLQAGTLIKTEFEGNSAKAVEYVIWSWEREKYLEDKHTGEQPRRRLSWYNQFVSRGLVVDYRRYLQKRSVRPYV